MPKSSARILSSLRDRKASCTLHMEPIGLVALAFGYLYRSDSAGAAREPMAR